MSRDAAAPDLRPPLLAAAAWSGAIVALSLPTWCWLVAVASYAVVHVWSARVSSGSSSPARRAVGFCVIGFGSVASVATLGITATTSGPVADMARGRAVVDAHLRITSDPRLIHGQYGDLVVLRGRLEQVVGRGQNLQLRAPVVVFADEEWLELRLGSLVRTSARLGPADDRQAAAHLSPHAAPAVVEEPDLWWRAASALRTSIRDAVAPRDPTAAALVPALVDGDDANLSPDLTEDFRTTGLTHLTAVSGTNLTLVVGALLILGRWCGLRARQLHLLAVAGIVGFMLVARTEPSVLRAAAMGSVALIAMTANGRQRGLRALSVAVVVLLLIAPTLALTAGFALSVLATAGILWLAPTWRDALMRWLPRWVAEAVAVPLAAQVACTPVVAGISGQVSLVAVAANLLAAPAVAPVTVLGLLGGLVGLVWTAAGQVIAAPAAWCAQWLVLVATTGAGLPMAAIDWGTSPVALATLTLACVAFVVMAPWLLRRPKTSVASTCLLVVVMLVRWPTPGWPPQDWVIAMCDVGQGDALVLNAGGGSAVVVDAGPDSKLIDGCLQRLGVQQVPLMLVTHFHADHLDGLAGVLDGRKVGQVEGTSLGEPASGVEDVRSAWGAAPTIAPFGVPREVGDVSLQVIWPPPDARHAATDSTDTGEGSAANNASVVLVADVRGVRILLTGDLEPPGQQAVARTVADLGVDVLKVPHHGSRHQHLPWLTGLGARVALISVGEDNGYGHPASDVIGALEASGAGVWRTDLSGDVLVVQRDGKLQVATRE